jgi:hypothetical protein
MTVREVLTIACNLLSKNDLSKKVSSSEFFTQDEQIDINQLLTVVNLVQDEVCTEYIPLVHQEDIQSEYGEKDISSLSKKLAYILSLKDNNGHNINYKIRGAKIVFDGKAVIEYCYVPEMVELESNFEFIIPARVLAYGVVREYYLSQDMPTEASVFEEKFKNSLLVFARKRSEIVMPKRIWR